MKILVTGAAGFIGFHLCQRLTANGDQVIGVDSINSYYDPALKYARLGELGISRQDADSCALSESSVLPNFSFQRLFVEDAQAVGRLFQEVSFDSVIHVAAQAGVRYSIENPRAYVEANIDGFMSILEGCRSVRASHLVFASSSSVYGLQRKTPFREHDPVDHPVSLYAATKRSNELMAHVYSHLYGIPATGLRFFTVYGPWGRPDMAYFKFARAIMNGDPIELYNSGNMVRDFTYIDDVVDAVLRVLARPPAPNPDWLPDDPDPASAPSRFRIYNIGNSRAEPLGMLVKALERSLGKKAKAKELPMQPGDVYATEADVTDMKRDFGWQPSTSLEEGISRFVRWFVAYEARSGAPDT